MALRSPRQYRLAFFLLFGLTAGQTASAGLVAADLLSRGAPGAEPGFSLGLPLELPSALAPAEASLLELGNSHRAGEVSAERYGSDLASMRWENTVEANTYQYFNFANEGEPSGANALPDGIHFAWGHPPPGGIAVAFGGPVKDDPIVFYYEPGSVDPDSWKHERPKRPLGGGDRPDPYCGSVPAVPLPNSLAFMVSGLFGLALLLLRKRNAAV